jgi:hypothetical protein
VMAMHASPRRHWRLHMLMRLARDGQQGRSGAGTQ